MRHLLPSTTDDRQLALPLEPVRLQRIEPSQNMARFYSMDVQRDLFGRVVVARQWGRIGTADQTRLDEYPDEGRAAEAMMQLEQVKRRRGYRPTGTAKSQQR